MHELSILYKWKVQENAFYFLKISPLFVHTVSSSWISLYHDELFGSFYPWKESSQAYLKGNENQEKL